MKKIIIGIFCLTAFLGISQIHSYEIGSSITGVNFDNAYRADSKADVVGSPYYNEELTLARISDYENENFALRYNAFQDEIEFKRNEELYYIPKTEGLSIKFVSPVKEYQFHRYTDKGSEVSGYLVLVSDTKVGLYLKEQIKFVEAREAENSYARDKPATYTKVANTYYIKLGDDITTFPKNRKELIKMFPDKKAEITAFLKKTKISFSKETDLINLVNFLSTI